MIKNKNGKKLHDNLSVFKITVLKLKINYYIYALF